MITDPDVTRIWRVRVRSSREKGEWFFAARDHAQGFVESKSRTRSQDVAWRRKNRDSWLFDEDGRTWEVKAVVVQDAAGILVDETATFPA